MYLGPGELEDVRLSDDRLAMALRTLRDTGMVVIEGVYSRDWVDELRSAFDAELDRYIAARGGLDAVNATSFGRNHIGIHLPLVPPFSDPQIVVNPIAMQIMTAALGDDLRCAFYHSNTAYPGSGRQEMHRDNPPLFGPEFGVPTPVVHVVLNIPLCDFTEENGSTEIWPGTHLMVDLTPEDGLADRLAARAQMMAPVRANIRAGCVVIRDLRLWHRGMPNNSREVRTMLALVYQRAWAAEHEFHKMKEIPRSTWDEWPGEARQVFRYNAPG